MQNLSAPLLAEIKSKMKNHCPKRTELNESSISSGTKLYLCEHITNNPYALAQLLTSSTLKENTKDKKRRSKLANERMKLETINYYDRP
jgi:hypothetical protein